jgi:hypothetical protein
MIRELVGLRPQAEEDDRKVKGEAEAEVEEVVGSKLNNGRGRGTAGCGRVRAVWDED